MNSTLGRSISFHFPEVVLLQWDLRQRFIFLSIKIKILDASRKWFLALCKYQNLRPY